MRVGKKLNVVEAKKTRSCVVRLEKVRSPQPMAKQTRGTATAVSNRSRTGAPAPPPSAEKTSRGPIKKRPVSQMSTPVAVIPKVKDKVVKVPPPANIVKMTPAPPAKIVKVTPVPTAKITKVTPAPPTPTVYETSPTIAAGRSRRAIKPNPKYASEDMVTPKIIRNVATLGSMSSSNKKSRSAASERLRKLSSSSDDFFNRESSDEMNLNELVDKAYNVDEKSDDSDSDFSDSDIDMTRVVPKKRGRPKKYEKTSPQQQQNTAPRPAQLPTKFGGARTPAAAAVASTTTTKFSPNIARSTGAPLKSTPLQLLRKTLAASVNRIATQSGATKRKLEPDNDSEMDDSPRKRLSVNTIGGQYKSFGSSGGGGVKEIKSIQQTLTNKSLVARKSLLSQTLNGSKINDSQTSEDDGIATYGYVQSSSPPEKRRTLTNKITTKPTAKAATISATKSTASHQMTSLLKSASGKVFSMSGKQVRSSSPATQKTASTTKESPKAASAADDKKVKESTPPPNTIDDFETMPTFTIVNINDIINKKGDVLISKAQKISPNSTSAGGATASKYNNVNKDRSESPKPSLTSVKRDRASPSVAPTIVAPPTADAKLSRRKAGNTTLADQPERQQKTSRISMPTSKKPTQTILNHTLATKTAAANAAMQRPKRGAASTYKMSAGDTSPEKPAPRILNATVAKKTQPVKPMIANLDDSADESFPLSLEEDDNDIYDAMDATTEEDEEVEEDNEDEDETFEIGGKKRKKLPPSRGSRFARKKTPKTVGRSTGSSQPATKENSLAANNRMPPSSKSKSKPAPTSQRKQAPPEKVVITRQGDKIIKKITCFETWYVINMPEERPVKILRNQLDVPLIQLANVSKDIQLPSDAWSSKVTLYELSSTTIAKSTLITYTGSLREHNISEEDRGKYQPSCVMFRRAVSDRAKSRLPFDRAVIFKNKTFYTNIEGKNVKMVGAPATINSEEEVEILLEIVDSLTLQNIFVEPATTVQ